MVAFAFSLQHTGPSDGDAFFLPMAMTDSEEGLISTGELMLIWLGARAEMGQDVL